MTIQLSFKYKTFVFQILVLVKILYTTICGAQVNEFLGTKGPDRFLPHLLGHEGSGLVVRCGPGVKTVKEEDLVVLHWRKGVGIQSETPSVHFSKLSFSFSKSFV